MTYETLEIGATPAEEECEQLGASYRPEVARRECAVFIRLLKRTFGEPPEGASYRIKGNPHDFWTYYEAAIKFDSDDEAAADYAYKVEEEAPTEWDDEARAELAI